MDRFSKIHSPKYGSYRSLGWLRGFKLSNGDEPAKRVVKVTYWRDRSSQEAKDGYVSS